MRKSLYMLVALAALMVSGLNNASAQQQVKVERNVRNGRPFLLDDRANNVHKSITKMGHGNLMGIPNLTKEQRSEIKDICLAEQKQMLQIRNQKGEKQAKLRTLETADKADIKEINKVIDEIAKLQGDMMKLKAETKQKTRALLTEEQRVKFDTRSKIGERMIKMRINRGDMPRSKFNINTLGYFDFNELELPEFDFEEFEISDFESPEFENLSIIEVHEED